MAGSRAREKHAEGMKQETAPNLATFKVALVVLCLASSLGIYPMLGHAAACPAGGDHSYSVTIIEYATGATDGTRLFTCTQCGYSYEQTIPRTGHHWGPWIVDLKPTCTAPGHEYRACTHYADNPHYEERAIPALSATGEHRFQLIEEVSSSCLIPGSRLFACSICGTAQREDTPALGHAWSEWVVDTDPTTSEEGREKRVCLHDAGHVEYQAIPVLDHPYSGNSPGGKRFFEVPEFFSSGPSMFDAVMLAIDFVVLAMFLLLMIPLIYQLIWINKKREEAREEYRSQVRERSSHR